MESRARIIAVDDEPEIGAIVAEYLGKSGYAVRTVLSGAALDAELAREPADLVLLDVNMPGEDGFSVARRLRAGAPVRIIMVTAANEVIDRVVGLEIGADDYVAKPFNLRELQARVSAILRRPLRAAPAPVAAAAEPPAPRVEGTRFGTMVLDNEGRALIAADGRRTTAFGISGSSLPAGRRQRKARSQEAGRRAISGGHCVRSVSGDARLCVQSAH